MRTLRILKTAFHIYKRDLKKITTSWVTLIIMFGLIILPPLYAWINIYASWDPYGNTKGIKVAVVNKDKGATLKDMKFEIGEETVKTLQKNEKLGWKFYDDADEAIKMAERGDVYATIVIPEDFSYRMTTLLNPNPIKPTLEYYVNEKENAIAPKMTDSAANTLQHEISASIIETATKQAFEKFSAIGVDIEKKFPDIEKYIDMLFHLDDVYPQMDEKLANLSKTVQDGVAVIDQSSNDFAFVRDTLDETIDLNNNFSDSLLNIDSRIKEYSPEVKENLLLAQSIFSNISNDMGALGGDVEKAKPELTKDIDDSIADFNNFESDVINLTDKLQTFNDETIPDIIELNKGLISDMREFKMQLYELKDSLDNWSEVKTLMQDLSTLSINMSQKLDSLQTKINQFFKGADNILAAVEKELTSIGDFLDGLQGNTDVQASANSIAQIVSQNNDKLANNSAIYSGILSANKDIYQNLLALTTNAGDQSAINDLKNNCRSLSAAVHAERTNLESQRSSIVSDITLTKSILTQISRVCNDVNGISTDDLSDNIDHIIERLGSMQGILSDNNKMLIDTQADGSEKITTRSSEILNKTNDLKDKLLTLKGKINDRNTLETTLYDTQKLTYNIQSALDRIVVSMDDSILPRIENYLKNGSVFIGDINRILSDVKENIQPLQDFLSDVSEDGKVSVDKINRLREKLPNLQKALSTISEVIKNVQNTLGLNDIIDFLKNDGAVEGDYFASPVSLSTHKLYDMKNYGTGLAPFYTVLALWVGGLFLVAILSTKVHDEKRAYTPRQEFIGKYLLFATIAIIQAIVVSLGDMFLLGISIHNPILFTLLAIFYSLLFSLIVFSLASTLGNVGKAVAIVLLLLQLTGSGGTFPIQVTPPFFQMIHNLLPFTYAISGFREAIYGVVFDTLVRDVLALLLFYVLFALVGVLLKKNLHRHVKDFSDKLSETGIIGH